METQKTKILNMLLDRPYVCVTEMMAAYIPDYRRRICDLKDDDYILESRSCQQHVHRSKNLKEWHLIGREEKKEEIKPLSCGSDGKTIWCYCGKCSVKILQSYSSPSIFKKITKIEILPNKMLYANLKEIKQEALF